MRGNARVRHKLERSDQIDLRADAMGCKREMSEGEGEQRKEAQVNDLAIPIRKLCFPIHWVAAQGFHV